MMKGKLQHQRHRTWKSRRRGIHAALALVSVLAMGLVAMPSARAQTYTETLLHTFTGPDGAFPGSLLVGSGGELYGVAGGGAYGYGAIFKITKTGAESVFYSFGPPPDGSSPGGLIQDSAGNLYGVTVSGGVYGRGTVFKLDVTGTETVLYNFTGGSDGSQPNSAPVRDSAGNLYGTAATGGDPRCGCGVVFKLTTAGVESVLHSFTGAPDGQTPEGGLIRGPAGTLYGTTVQGGNSDGGTIFGITSVGTYSVLYNFGRNGVNPTGGVIQDAAGNFYGTLSNYGGSLYGTVYKISAKGKETTLYSFLGDKDGETPYAGLVRDSAGNLYGTTWMGGGAGSCYGGFYFSGCGTVFEVSASGKESVLHAFAGPPDGQYNGNGLVRDAAGNLYGTTYEGGNPACNPTYGCGVVFKITP